MPAVLVTAARCCADPLLWDFVLRLMCAIPLFSPNWTIYRDRCEFKPSIRHDVVAMYRCAQCSSRIVRLHLSQQGLPEDGAVARSVGSKQGCSEQRRNVSTWTGRCERSCQVKKSTAGRPLATRRQGTGAEWHGFGSGRGHAECSWGNQ